MAHTCTTCGLPLADSATTCAQCGSALPLSAAPPPSSARRTLRPRGRRLAPWIAGMGGALILAAAVLSQVFPHTSWLTPNHSGLSVSTANSAATLAHRLHPTQTVTAPPAVPRGKACPMFPASVSWNTLPHCGTVNVGDVFNTATGSVTGVPTVGRDYIQWVIPAGGLNISLSAFSLWVPEGPGGGVYGQNWKQVGGHVVRKQGVLRNSMEQVTFYHTGIYQALFMAGRTQNGKRSVAIAVKVFTVHAPSRRVG